MIQFLIEKTASLLTILIVLVFVVVFVTAHYFIHRSRTGEKPENEVVNLVGHLIGMLYAVLLAFVVVSSWDNFDKANENTDIEINALGELYRMSLGFPPEMQKTIHENIVLYSELETVE